MTFTLDDKKLLKFEKDLAKFSKTAVPFAIKSTINGAAFKARTFAREAIKEKMVQRNQFTMNSVRVVQAKSADDVAIMGTIAPYMEDQEQGATHNSGGKHGVPLPTSYSAGQGHAGARTKLPTRPNKMQNIVLRRAGARAKNRRQANKIAVMEAVSSGNKYVYLDLFRRKGIFRVTGGKRNPNVEMVHDLSNKSVVIPRNPIIEPAAMKARGHMQQIWYDALVFQSKRLGLLWG